MVGARLSLAVIIVTIAAACSSQAPPTPATSPGTTATPAPLATPYGSTSPSPWLELVSPGWAGAAWSPDGRWLMVWRRPMNGPLEQSELDIDQADGLLVEQFSGTGDNDIGGFVPTWLDATHFLAIRGGRVVVGMTDSRVLTPIAVNPGLGLSSNGRGAIAMVNATVSVSSPAAHFVVVTTAGMSSPRPGIPVGWSHDGSRLVVWHWVRGDGYEAVGWLEILSWPGLRTVAAFPHDLSGGESASDLFDLTDRYFLDNGRLHDLVTGDTTAVLWPHDEVVDATWNDKDELVGASLIDGRAIAYDVHGHQVFATAPLGDDISGSLDGAVIGLWFGDTGGNALTLLTRDGQGQLLAPGPIQGRVLFSPDGSGLVIDSLSEPLLHRP